MNAIPFHDAAAANRALRFPALVEHLRAAFLSPPLAPDRMLLTYGEKQDQHLLIMPAVNPRRLIGVKLVTVHEALSARPGGAVRALFVALDAATGDPLALIDGQALTERRTAAASVLAAKALANPGASVILVIGTGRIARALCACYHEVFGPARLMLWGRSRDAVSHAAAELRESGVSVEVAQDLAAACRQADIISAATLSTVPLIFGRHLKLGAHVDLVGGFTPAMREADDETFARAAEAGVLVADGPQALETAGDLVQPIAAGIVDRAAVRMLGDVLAGRSAGRTSPQDITVFKSVGLALEDLAAAELLLEELLPGRVCA